MHALCLKGSSSLVGVGMMDVVLDPPGLEGVYERGKHKGAHNVLYQLVLAEGTVPTVMPHHKKLHIPNSPYSCRQLLALKDMPLTRMLLHVQKQPPFV